MFSVIDNYGDDLTKKQYVTNPSIARDAEIKKSNCCFINPEKSALLVGKAGIGKQLLLREFLI